MLFGICAGLAGAQELSFVQPAPTEGHYVSPRMDVASAARLWKVSIATLSVANALDVQSSWGKHELNGTLSGPSGNFGGQGALIKLGFQGGLIGLEYLITRGHPSGKLYHALSIVNFGASAAIGSVAAHNYTVARP